MGVIYKRVLANGIIDEREGRGYKMDGNDKDVLKRMCDEINELFPNHPYKYHYLAEIRICRCKWWRQRRITPMVGEGN